MTSPAEMKDTIDTVLAAEGVAPLEPVLEAVSVLSFKPAIDGLLKTIEAFSSQRNLSDVASQKIQCFLSMLIASYDRV